MPVLTPEQQKRYYAEEGPKAAPISPLAWLEKQNAPAKQIQPARVTAPSAATPIRAPGEPIADFTRRIDGSSQQLQPSPPPAPSPVPPPTPPPPIVRTSEPERAKKRAEEIERIKSELNAGISVPTPFKSSEEYEKLRKEQGLVQDEQELSALQNEALLAQQELRTFRSQQKGLPEAGRLGAVSEAERNLSFRLEGMAIREQAVIARLNTKNAYINTALQLGLADYKTSRANYEFEYNKNLKVVELYNAQLEDQEKDALTALTTLSNLFKDRDVMWDSVNPSLKAQINAYL